MKVEYVKINTEPAHRERMRKEYFDLLDKTVKLSNMLQKWQDNKLGFEPACPYELLEKQHELMTEYLKVLETRAKIEGFKL